MTAKYVVSCPISPNYLLILCDLLIDEYSSCGMCKTGIVDNKVTAEYTSKYAAEKAIILIKDLVLDVNSERHPKLVYIPTLQEIKETNLIRLKPVLEK
jgi:hypothetical protein